MLPILSILIVFLGILPGIFQADPTLYEYYTSGGIKSGLNAQTDQFTLNGKHFVIYSGSMHYFRILPQQWRVMLQRLKAAGLNSVQFYLPWNLHEEIPGKFDFESDRLNLAIFLKEIKRADMFAIVRPGPYICSEWDLGGYPSWLLHDPQMQLRNMYPPHLERVKLYLEHAMSIINRFQFTTNGGPVIMLQLENEFGWSDASGPKYLNFLRDLVHKSGFNELFFVSSPVDGAEHNGIKDVFSDNTVLQAANFNTDTRKHLTELKRNQPNKPAYVSEFWSGWFDRWGQPMDPSRKVSIEKFEHELSDILFSPVNGSVNFYMFVGGTNFGFMPGHRIVTSYNYGASLTDSGNYTEKYYKTRELYQKLVSSGRFPKVHLPEVPPAPTAHAYGKVGIEAKLSLEQILKHVSHKFDNVKRPVPMELLNFTDQSNYGQQFGFILYRVVEEKPIKEYNITGHIHDHAIFLLDHHKCAVIEDGAPNFIFSNFSTITYAHSNETSKPYKYDLFVENMGRINGYDMTHERRGILNGSILLDGQVAENITIYSLDFDAAFVHKLSQIKWIQLDDADADQNSPTLYRAHLVVQEPKDTYLSLPGWTKGLVLVNGFNIGRYWDIGPQKSLYIPGPLLKTGQNAIEVFELHKRGKELEFLDRPLI